MKRGIPTTHLRAKLIFVVGSLFIFANSTRSQETPPPADVAKSYVTITGTVTDHHNRPVADAKIYLAPALGSDNNSFLITTSNEVGEWSFKLTYEPNSDVVVLARKKGYSLGVAKRDVSTYINNTQQIRFGETVELPIKLGESSKQTLHIVDPTGMPAAKTRLQLIGIYQLNPSMAFPWNDKPAPDFFWEVDSNGKVNLDELPEKYVFILLLHTPENGVQGLNLGTSGVAEEVVVTLLPTCRVQVSLSSDEARLLNERELSIHSQQPLPRSEQARNASPSKLTPFRGTARVRTDASGKASAIVPAGAVTISLDRLTDDKHFLEPIPVAQGAPGETVAIEIPLKPGTKVKGKIQTASNEPIANALFQFADAKVTSKVDGTFEFWIPRGSQLNGQLLNLPDGFSFPFESRIFAGEADKSVDDAKREIPPIIVRRSSPISGQVVDEAGEPVRGARIVASWVQQHETGGYFTLKSDVRVSDSNGRFVLGRVFPGVDVIVTASKQDKCVLEAIQVNSTTPRELPLTITPAGMIPIVGKVQDTEGNPVTNATISVARAIVAPTGHSYGTEQLNFDGQREFNGQSDGSFQSPIKVPRFGKYSITISAPGYLTADSPFVTAIPNASALDVGTTKLVKARAIRGVIRDSAGTPVPNAEVWSWAASTGRTSTPEKVTVKTDEAGQFNFDRVHPAAALAFAKKDGFRFTGIPLSSGVSQVELMLYRNDEPLPASKIVRPTSFDMSRHHAVAEKLLNGVTDQRNSNYFGREMLSMLVKANPAAARERLGEVTSTDNRARTLAELGEIQDALAEAETISNANARADCRMAIADRVQDADTVREILAEALLDAQSIREPDRRVVVVANIADRFSRLHDDERVAAILREELPRAEALSRNEWPGFARGYFATQLARIDPTNALRLVSELDGKLHARHYQNIAHVVAATNPDIAEEAIRRIGKHSYVDEPCVRVAYRMASVDVSRAIKLLDVIDSRSRPVERARGLGIIAWAIHKKDPAQARTLLQQAYASIPPQTGGFGSRTDNIFGTGLELLRYAEDIDPEGLTEYFWIAASLHPGPSGGAWSPDDSIRADAERQARLVLLLLLYDAAPELPRQVMGPAFEYWESQFGTESHHFTDHEGTFMAMALADPERASDWARQFYEKLKPDHRRYIPQPWEVIGKTLTSDHHTLSEYTTREVFHRWVIDQFDY